MVGIKKRAHGEASRQRILAAAAEIAGERGYEGTSISLVSKCSGLPASSIYHHFKDKDDLIAAVVQTSFDRWFHLLQEPTEVPEEAETPEELFQHAMQGIGRALFDSPDFLRLGLMLVLEHRPEEPTARKDFLNIRKTVMSHTRIIYTAYFTDLKPDDIESLVTLTLVLSDGLFLAHEAENLDLDQGFGLIALAILGTAEQLMK